MTRYSDFAVAYVLKGMASVITILLIPLAFLVLPTVTTMVHATTVSGTLEGTFVTLGPWNQTNGNTIYRYVLTGNYFGSFSGSFSGSEIAITYPNGSTTLHGTEIIIGSYDGSPPGSIIGQYWGSINAVGYFQGTEVFSRGNFGLALLQVDDTVQGQVTGATTYTGNYTVTASVKTTPLQLP